MGVDQRQAYRMCVRGAFRLFRPDGERITLTSQKGAALLAMLATAPGGERSRAWLQARLWGSRATEQAQASLRRELSSLRAVVNCTGFPALLRVTKASVAIHLDHLESDVHEPGDVQAEFLEGVDLAGEEEFEDWLRIMRQGAGLRPSLFAQPSHPAPSPDIDGAQHDVLAPKPSIAVLPFEYRGDAQWAEAFADSLSEDISIGLSRYSTLLVVTAGRAAPDRQRTLQPSRICAELDVRYLLDGSIRQSGDRVSIAVSLIDCVAAGAAVWGERFTGTLTDAFDLQDRIATAVAARVDSSIERRERAKASARPVRSTDSYALYWRANALFRRWDGASIAEAVALCDRILIAEPENSWAAALAAFCRAMIVANGWADDPVACVAEATANYRLALREGADDAAVLGYVAGALWHLGDDMVVADLLVARALAIHPMASSTLSWGGWIDVANGRPERALERLELALRLNPQSGVLPLLLVGVGFAHLALGDHDAAIASLRESLCLEGGFAATVAGLAAALALCGRRDEASRHYRRPDMRDGIALARRVIRDPHLCAQIEAGIGLAAEFAAEADRDDTIVLATAMPGSGRA